MWRHSCWVCPQFKTCCVILSPCAHLWLVVITAWLHYVTKESHGLTMSYFLYCDLSSLNAKPIDRWNKVTGKDLGVVFGSKVPQGLTCNEPDNFWRLCLNSRLMSVVYNHVAGKFNFHLTMLLLFVLVLFFLSYKPYKSFKYNHVPYFPVFRSNFRRCSIYMSFSGYRWRS